MRSVFTRAYFGRVRDYLVRPATAFRITWKGYVVGSNPAKLVASAVRICASVRGCFAAAARVALTCRIAVDAASIRRLSAPSDDAINELLG